LETMVSGEPLLSSALGCSPRVLTDIHC